MIQAGKNLTCALGDGADPEVFTLLPGVRVTELRIQRRPVPAVYVTSGAWQKELGESGIAQVQLTLEGLFTDASVEESLRAMAFNGAAANVKVSFGNGDDMVLPAMIRDYQRQGAINGAEEVRVVLQSSGNVTYNAA